MKINLTDKKIKSDLEIILTNGIKDLEDKEILEQLGFEGKDETSLFLPESKKIFAGYEGEDYESLAIAIAQAVKKVKSTKYESASLVLDSDCSEKLKAIVEGIYLSSYEFNKYSSKKEKKTKQTINIFVPKLSKKLEDIYEESKTVSKAVNKVRDMVNTAPADFYPKTMANVAKDLAKDVNIKAVVHGEKYLLENKMNSMYSVGKASTNESKLIHLSYTPKNAKKKIVLVGKGLTYDSGGLSLKPADFMVTMKMDKSGGCAVLGTIWAAAKLGLDVEIHAIVGAVENMVAGNAYKPDDILTAKNGKTIEVRNTDAEGRLVLADCLCYAQDEIKDIDYIFDYATLTGACVVGVGQYTTGVMGNCDKLKQTAVKRSHEAGEYATALDFNRFLRKAIKSQIADVCNIANTRYGGAITAGLFLDNFIYEENKNKWLHFDIAGPAYVEKEWGYNPYGGTGAAVRMNINLLKNLIK